MATTPQPTNFRTGIEIEADGIDTGPGARPPIPPASMGRIAVFIVAVLGLGWLGPLLDRQVGTGNEAGPGQLVWILVPVVTALLLRWRTADRFTDAGFRPRYRENRWWFELSSAFYLVVMLAAAGGGLAADHYDLVDDASPLRFAMLAAFGLIPVMFTAMAEEFGWRGYLTPRLEAAGVGRFANHLIVGVVWGAWHFPYMTELWFHTDESPWTLGLRVVVGCTAAAVVYGEIRLRTGSVWPAVLMHATGNAVAGALLNDDVLTGNEATPWLFSPGIDGVVVISLTTAVAALLWARRSTTT